MCSLCTYIDPISGGNLVIVVNRTAKPKSLLPAQDQIRARRTGSSPGQIKRFKEEDMANHVDDGTGR